MLSMILTSRLVFLVLFLTKCRWGYSDLAAVQTVVERYAQAKIPLDNMWNDID